MQLERNRASGWRGDPGVHASDLKKMIDLLKIMCGYTSYKVSQYNMFHFGAIGGSRGSKGHESRKSD